MTTAHAKHPYSVRKVTSGYTGAVTYIVVKNPGGRRVSTEGTISREGAWWHADQLNIAAMIRDYADDPRPHDERKAEATANYRRDGS